MHITSPLPVSSHPRPVATVARAMVSSDLFCKKRLLAENLTRPDVAEDSGGCGNFFAILEKKDIDSAESAAGY
jgi:hypothetical protein